MNIQDEGFHNEIEKQHEAELERIAEVNEPTKTLTEILDEELEKDLIDLHIQEEKEKNN